MHPAVGVLHRERVATVSTVLAPCSAMPRRSAKTCACSSVWCGGIGHGVGLGERAELQPVEGECHDEELVELN